VIKERILSVMYCGHCGTKTQPDWVFCKECGHRLQPEASASEINVPEHVPVAAKAPRQPIQLSRQTKIWGGIGAGVVVLLLITFLVLRATYGPTSAEELAQQMDKAVQAGDVNTLASYLDDPDSPLHQADRIALFTETLQTDDAKKAYTEGIAEALDNAEDLDAEHSSIADSVKKQIKESLSGGHWLTFVPVDSWRGTKWTAHIEPVQIEATLPYLNENLTTSMTIGSVVAQDNVISDLWPSIYTYKGMIGGEFAEVPVTDKVEAFNIRENNKAILDYTKLASLEVHLPTVESTITLNDKKVTGTPGDYISILPTPAQAKFVVTTQTQGSEITGEATLQADAQDRYDLNTLLQKPIAEKSLDLIYNASTSLAEAINTSNAKAVKGVNPDSDYYNRATWEMNSYFTQPKYTLQKVVIDLDSIQINKESIEISATQVYTAKNEDGTSNDKNVNWTYQITQQPNQKQWWIDSAYTSWTNALNAKNTIEKASNATTTSAETDSTDQVSANTVSTSTASTDEASSESSEVTDTSIHDFMTEYLSTSVEAINAGDFSMVSSLLDAQGPVYKESSSYIDHLQSKGITEELVSSGVESFKANTDQTYTVNTTETYKIIAKDGTFKTKSFHSVYTLKLINNELKAYQLVSTKEI
jgi:uncharacterized membrane protein YvbJ